MVCNFLKKLIMNYVFIINIILFYKYNCIKLKELILYDFIVKVKINGIGYQNIINSEIINYDNQTYPDEISIENKNGEIKNISGGAFNINLEENENSVIMKWHTYPNSTRFMFYNCINITEIDLTQFDLALITNMVNMFYNCYNLTNVTFGNYDTSNLNNVYGMFNVCIKLTSINLSMFDTSNVVNMGFMFFQCSSLQSLNLSNFKTGKVKNFFKMFRWCKSLETLDLSNFDTSSATNISYMFSDCTILSLINISSFNTSNIIDMSYL